MAADIGKIIERLVKMKAELKRRQDAVKETEEEIERVKRDYMDALGGVGLKEGRNKTHSAAIVEKVVPQVTNWDHFLGFVHDNKYYHLLQRRPSTTGCAELWEQGSTIPGCEQFKKVDISLRSL